MNDESLGERLIVLRKHTLSEGMKDFDKELASFKGLMPRAVTEFQPTKVLGVTDGNDAGSRAIKASLKIARKFEASLLTMHVGKVMEGREAIKGGEYARQIEKVTYLKREVQKVIQSEDVNLLIIPYTILTSTELSLEILEEVAIPIMIVK